MEYIIDIWEEFNFALLSTNGNGYLIESALTMCSLVSTQVVCFHTVIRTFSFFPKEKYSPCLWTAVSMEFSLNEFHWIPWIQWIVTKSKNGMVIRSIVFLALYTLAVIAMESTFSSLLPIRYLLLLITLNRYLPRDSRSNTNFIFPTSLEDVSGYP